MGLFNLLPLLITPVFYLLIPTFSAQEFPVIGAQPPPPPPPPYTAAEDGSRTNPFNTSIVIIVAILTTIFSIIFLLLLYIKHCKPEIYTNTSINGYPPSRTNSGINRKVIESLPMFRFSSLRGQKDGLECAVCLNKFEPNEILRLLPKCKHAFHVECVDTWLDGHSTCPLCRYRVDPEDVLLVDSKSLYNHNHSNQSTPRSSDHKISGNARVSGRHTFAGERANSLDIIVENPGNDARGRVSLDSWNSRRKKTENCKQQSLQSSVTSPRNTSCNTHRCRDENGQDNSCRRSRTGRKDGQLPVQGDKHRLEHRIIISGGGEEAENEEGQRRWSNVQAAELLYLRTEMILEEGGSGRGVINERSVSEITGVSRYRSNNGGREGEEGVVKRWLDWVSHHKPAVDSAPTSSSGSAIVV